MPSAPWISLSHSTPTIACITFDIYTVNRKKHTKMFYLIFSLQSLADCDKIWCILSWVNLSYSNLNDFRLTRTSLSLTKVIWEDGRTRTPQSPHWLQWSTPNSPPKVSLHVDWSQTPLPASSLDPSDLRCQTASGSVPSFFPECTGQTDASTDAQTDRSFTGKFDDYRPLHYESDAA